METQNRFFRGYGYMYYGTTVRLVRLQPFQQLFPALRERRDMMMMMMMIGDRHRY